jgi:hypothetical protein
MDVTQATEALGSALADASFDVARDAVVDGGKLVARRVDRKPPLVRMHTFVVVIELNEVTPELAEKLTAAAQQYAIDHKGGLPRGLQTGTMTIVVFLGHASESAARWFAADPKHRFAALRFPVLADPGTGELTYFRGRMSRGFAYGPDLLTIVESIIAPALLAGR